MRRVTWNGGMGSCWTGLTHRIGHTYYTYYTYYLHPTTSTHPTPYYLSGFLEDPRE